MNKAKPWSNDCRTIRYGHRDGVFPETYIFYHLFYIIRDLTVHQCCTVSLGHKETAALVPSAPGASDDAVAEQQSSSGRALVCTSWRYINGINGPWFINHGPRTINHGIVTMKLDRYKRPKQFNFHEIE